MSRSPSLLLATTSRLASLSLSTSVSGTQYHARTYADKKIFIERDGASHVDELKSIELFKVDVNDRQPIKVQDSWTGETLLQQAFNIKDKLPQADSEDGKSYAYFYK